MKPTVSAEKRRFGLGALLITLMLASCTHYRPALHPIYASSEPIAGRSYQVTDHVKGESCQWWVLANFPVSKGGRVADAYADAIASGADALTDVTVDTKMVSYPFVRKHCVIVEGQAIKFQ